VCDGTEPIADDEILYRRIPLNWYSSGILDSQTFQPNKEKDADGLSFSRAKYKTKTQAAMGRPGKQYYVAELSARQIRALGIQIEPRPQPNDPGHTTLPELNSASRKESRVIECGYRLKDFATNIEGPYTTP
jgi:hypothetical protein